MVERIASAERARGAFPGAAAAGSVSRSGRVFGIWSPARGLWSVESEDCAAPLSAMARALGPGARELTRSGALADADSCFLDGAAVVDFGAALGRLADVIGPFAVAAALPDGSLRLASDPIGHRSLYYARLEDGGLVFASALDGVLASGLVPRRLAARAVPLFLTFAYVPGCRTLAEGVEVLSPGTELTLGARGITLRRFAALPGQPASYASAAELEQSLSAELEGAVSRALPGAAEPAGATLSGGIDSSLVLALARRLHRGPMRAYSVSFGPEHPNELVWSRLVAEHLGVPHEVVVVTPEIVASELDATVASLSQPNGDPLTVPNTLLFRRAAHDTRIVLNGEGGDPCFGGPKNAPMLLAELLGSLDERSGHARAQSYLRAHQKCYDELGAMLLPHVAARLAHAELEELVTPWLEDARWPSLLNRLMALNITFKGAHHILPKVADLSFDSGVCPRSPLFDRRLVEFTFSIPPGLKRQGAVEKYLLKRAATGLLPPSIIERPKSGMLVPVEAWFKGPLLGWARGRLLDGLGAWGLFDRTWLEALLDARLPGLRPRRGVKIWLLLTLESWLRQKLLP